MTNLSVVQKICTLLDARLGSPFSEGGFGDLIQFVSDRPGHDTRYAIDASKLHNELGWQPLETFESGIERTVSWYLANPNWWGRIKDGSYQFNRIGKREATV